MTARFRFTMPFVLLLVSCTSARESSVTADAGAGDAPASAVDGSPIAPYACDPLNTPAAPLTLANLLGAGRHADGTFYVVDDGGRDHMRAFVSMGTTLQRAIILGSGSDIAALTVSLEDPQAAIKIEGPSPHPSRMGVYRGALAAKTFDIGTQGDELTLVDRDALSGFTPMNIDDNVAIECNASLTDGRRFFVVRPRIDGSYEDFRVFFGTPNDMRERAVVSVSRHKDGGTTDISFTVEDTEYHAYLPSKSAGGTPTITPAAAAAIPLTLLPTDKSAAAGLAFVCTT